MWLNARDVHAQSRILDPWCTVQYSMYQKNLSIYLKDPWQKKSIYTSSMYTFLLAIEYLHLQKPLSSIHLIFYMHAFVGSSVRLSSITALPGVFLDYYAIIQYLCLQILTGKFSKLMECIDYWKYVGGLLLYLHAQTLRIKKVMFELGACVCTLIQCKDLYSINLCKCK